jgi:hypothetical protein
MSEALRHLLAAARREWAWIAGGVTFGALVLLALVLGTGLSRPAPVGPTPIDPWVTLVSVSTAAPTVPTTPTPTAESTATPPPTLDPDTDIGFTIGDLVEVYGTEGDGLRLRAEPSLDAVVLVLGVDSEVFEVVGGPEYSDGYVWVRLVNPFDPLKTGWAVSTYLRRLGAP